MDKHCAILIVDDEPDNFDVIEILLFREGYRLDYVSSGTAALNYLKEKQPDVILLDVMMPDLNGITACRLIKENPEWRHIPIIIVTALGTKEDLARCLDAGADDFISKPVNGVELRARVRSMLRIKQQYDHLEAVLQIREDLSNMIVHDLRNPLSTIMLACEILKLAQLEEKYNKKVEQISGAGQRLHTLIDSLLLMAKMQAGKMVLDLKEVDLVEMSQQVIVDFQELAAQKQIRLVHVGADSQCRLQLDANVFRRILDNLLSNAIKFAPPHSEVTVRLTSLNADHATIEVADCGIGVSEELKQRLFSPYETGRPADSVTQTGLGLAFCKMAIEAHGGKITVQTNRPRGAVFVVEI